MFKIFHWLTKRCAMTYESFHWLTKRCAMTYESFGTCLVCHLIVSDTDEKLQKTLITKFSMVLPGFLLSWLELKNAIKKFFNFILTQSIHSVEDAIYFGKLEKI